MVADAGAQQEVRDRQHARPARPRSGAPAGGDGRRDGREFQAGHAREMAARPGGPAQGQSAADHRAGLRLRPDRPLCRPSGLRQRRRGDGRHPLHQRLSRPAAAALRHLARRHADGAVRVRGADDGAVLARRGRRRQRPGDRRLDRRELLFHAGKHAAGIRQMRRGAQARREPAWPMSRPPTSTRPATAPTW